MTIEFIDYRGDMWLRPIHTSIRQRVRIASDSPISIAIVQNEQTRYSATLVSRNNVAEIDLSIFAPMLDEVRAGDSYSRCYAMLESAGDTQYIQMLPIAANSAGQKFLSSNTIQVDDGLPNTFCPIGLQGAAYHISYGMGRYFRQINGTFGDGISHEISGWDEFIVRTTEDNVTYEQHVRCDKSVPCGLLVKWQGGGGSLEWRVFASFDFATKSYAAANRLATDYYIIEIEQGYTSSDYDQLLSLAQSEYVSVMGTDGIEYAAEVDSFSGLRIDNGDNMNRFKIKLKLQQWMCNYTSVSKKSN